MDAKGKDVITATFLVQAAVCVRTHEIKLNFNLQYYSILVYVLSFHGRTHRGYKEIYTRKLPKLHLTDAEYVANLANVNVAVNVQH